MFSRITRSTASALHSGAVRASSFRGRVDPRLSVILMQDVDRLGVQGQEVLVKHGYGRNYLLPRGLAVYGTPLNKQKYMKFSAAQAEQSQEQQEESMLQRHIREYVGPIAGLDIIIQKQCKPDDSKMPIKPITRLDVLHKVIRFTNMGNFFEHQIEFTNNKKVLNEFGKHRVALTVEEAGKSRRVEFFVRLRNMGHLVKPTPEQIAAELARRKENRLRREYIKEVQAAQKAGLPIPARKVQEVKKKLKRVVAEDETPVA